MFDRWKPYVPVAKRRKQAERAAGRIRGQDKTLLPVAARRGAIAETFWGKAWCDNLERYSDYSNRLPRGRTYLRNGSVIDLRIAPGKIAAQVMGSDLYRISVEISAVAKPKWQALGSACAGSIDSLVELLQGRFSKGVMERICQPGTGLFPSPQEIRFSCSCPDWAAMCKHVAAVFYGVGARLDHQPELLFALRRVDARDLVARAGTALPFSKGGPASGKVLDPSKVAAVFDIDMADVAIPAPAKKKKRDRATISQGTAAAAAKSSVSKKGTARSSRSGNVGTPPLSAARKKPARREKLRNP